MTQLPHIEKLTSSWTKYDSVKVIEITLSGELNDFIRSGGQTSIAVNSAVLKNYLGIDNLDDEIPSYWLKIYNYPRQIGLFSLIAAIFTHHYNIDLFAKFFSQGNMQGSLTMEADKHHTNLRSALVVSGAADKIFRRKAEVPYDLSPLFESGEVGELTKALLWDRLLSIGCTSDELKESFFEISTDLNFPAVFSLTNQQFFEWLSGNGISNSLFELSKNDITYEKYGRIKALKVKQWLDDWDTVQNYDQKNRRRPEKHFYQFNIPALLLKRIYEIHSRRAFSGRTEEPYSQRKHSEQRSNEIKEFVKGGYPWSTISLGQRESDIFKNLQMPGWLPTSIIANILSAGSERKQKKIEDDSVIRIEDIDDNFADIILPEKIWSEDWTPLVSPIEIIDGQHRIKAFDNIRELKGNYEFPIIAFNNLDFTWQAYLFYTINIKPKRINTSLAYDLMPLLRIQDWLEQDLNGPDIYKKVRAQELTELLWSCPISPWHDRINMLGDTGANRGGPVSQNAFINSLTISFVKKWEGKTGGLFGGEMNEGQQDVIQWDKETQAAYLIQIWRSINSAIGKSKAEWVSDLKSQHIPDIEENSELSIGFIHPHSFFTTDQGVRPILLVFNDMSFVASDSLGLPNFYPDLDYERFSITEVIEHIVLQLRENQIISTFISTIASELVNKFDWRTPSAFDPKDLQQDEKRQRQNQFRGSGGYREMRIQLMRVLEKSTEEVKVKGGTIKIADIAKAVQTKLGL